jgi:zinc protease
VALAGIREELDKIVGTPVPKAELERAKRYLVGAHEISLQRRAALASTLAFHDCYGLGWDEYRRYAAAILEITSADVQRVAKRYLDGRRAIIATVKPEEATPAVANPKLKADAANKAARANGARTRRGR